MSDDRYLLDHHEEEWRRLDAQHLVWRHTLLPTVEKALAGRSAPTVLEVGCGNGVLLADLADLVGSGGQALGLEINPEAHARARARLAGRPWVAVESADLLLLDENAYRGRFDLIVARWVLSFLPELERVLGNLKAWLKPGGVLLVQDYAYDAIRLLPEQKAISRLFEVTPRAYAAHGGDAWVAHRLPGLFVAAGLDLESVEPHCQAGGPDSAIFGWVERFFLGFAGKLCAEGFLSAEERDASRAGWSTARSTPGTVFYSPLVINVLGRKPS
jgi:SAM-dependent methyltransferase